MLKIQEHLINVGLEATIKKFNLEFKDLGHKFMLKYHQIDSPKSAIEVQESRGLVLEKNTYRIISMPFKRFFTYDDFYAAKINYDNAVYTEKRDGTLIQIYYDDIINQWS